MLVQGRISWFSPEEWVKNKEGEQIYNQYGEPVKKRRIGVDADYGLEDGTIVRERFVTETPRDFSDEELQQLMDSKVTKCITIHFDDRTTQNGHHFMNCILTQIQEVYLDD